MIDLNDPKNFNGRALYALDHGHSVHTRTDDKGVRRDTYRKPERAEGRFGRRIRWMTKMVWMHGGEWYSCYMAQGGFPLVGQLIHRTFEDAIAREGLDNGVEHD